MRGKEGLELGVTLAVTEVVPLAGCGPGGGEAGEEAGLRREALLSAGRGEGVLEEVGSAAGARWWVRASRGGKGPVRFGVVAAAQALPLAQGRSAWRRHSGVLAWLW